MQDVSCGHCLHFVVDPEQATAALHGKCDAGFMGKCRRYPPTITWIGECWVTKHPHVPENGCCGEFDEGTTVANRFNRLCILEPMLLELYSEACRHHHVICDVFCANKIWYGYAGKDGIKDRLLKLVGYDREAGPEVLRTSESYDIVYDYIYDALPDCKGYCACLSLVQEGQ